MSKSTAILKWLLLLGAVYFLAISIVHMVKIRVPILFAYYDAPSYGYQDSIISFLSFGWSVFLFTASIDPAKNRDAVKAILIAGLGAVFGLNLTKSNTAFHVLYPNIHPAVFGVEVLGLSLYVAALILFYFLAKGENPNR